MAVFKWHFFIILLVLVASFMIPAYAEVNSFQVDKSFYTTGNKIYFTGTVEIGDYQKRVTLVIHDPLGKFVLISGNYSDSIYTFEVVVNTNDTTQFSTKGTYSATAFVGTPDEGKTIAFDFSPDGSPVIHQTPQNIIETSNVGQPSSQHFVTQLNENIAMSDIGENLTKIQPSSVIEKPSSEFDFKNILYPVISLCGVGIVVAVIYFRKMNLKLNTKANRKPESTSSVISGPEDDHAIVVLKNRLAKGEITLDEFNSIKDVLLGP